MEDFENMSIAVAVHISTSEVKDGAEIKDGPGSIIIGSCRELLFGQMSVKYYKAICIID